MLHEPDAREARSPISPICCLPDPVRTIVRSPARKKPSSVRAGLSPQESFKPIASHPFLVGEPLAFRFHENFL